LKRQRHEGAEAELARHLLPVLERFVGEDVGHFDHLAVARRLPARPEADADAHVAEESGVAMRPAVDRAESHELRAVFDQIHAGGAGADQRAHAVERELVDVLGFVRGEEGVHDLAQRHELADAGLGPVDDHRGSDRRGGARRGERGGPARVSGGGLSSVGDA